MCHSRTLFLLPRHRKFGILYFKGTKEGTQMTTKLYSKAEQDEPVNSIPSMSFQRNQYQKDVYKAAAEKNGVSVNYFLREAGLEKADKLGIK